MAGSWRREPLPPGWSKLRARILRRDGNRCTHLDDYSRRCEEPATDVDHILPGSDHRESNLRSLCGYHHDKKTALESAASRVANREKIEQKFRRTEAHPGEL